jgi:hypothetical protein
MLSEYRSKYHRGVRAHLSGGLGGRVVRRGRVGARGVRGAGHGSNRLAGDQPHPRRLPLLAGGRTTHRIE